MARLLIRSLLTDKGRTLLSILAVAAAIALVLLLEGFKVGLYQQVRAYRESLPVQLIATQAGVANMSLARLALPPTAWTDVERVEGVEAAHPLVIAPMIFTTGETKTPVSVIGYHDVGGPQWIAVGRSIAGPGELVMDRPLARKHDLEVGDNTVVLGKEFRVVGLSTGTSSLFGSYLFIRLEDAVAITAPGRAASTPDTVAPSVLLIQVRPDAAIEGVQRGIEAAALAVDVFTPSELADNDVAAARKLLGSIVDLLIRIGYLVGVLVVGLTLYAAVFERLREYGVMKALGARNARLYGQVLGQGLVFAGLGFVFGLLAAGGASAMLAWLTPQYQTVPWDAQALVRTGTATLVISAIASLLPIRQIAGVDPTVVFRQ
jgi:putative ABC transport system permease protein